MTKENTTEVEMLNARQACVLLQMSDGGLYNLVHRGILPPPEKLNMPTATGGMITMNHWRLDDVLDAKTSGKIKPRKKYGIGATKKERNVVTRREAGLTVEKEAKTKPDVKPAPEPMTVVQDALDVTKEHVEPVEALREVAASANDNRSFVVAALLMSGAAFSVSMALLLERFL